MITTAAIVRRYLLLSLLLGITGVLAVRVGAVGLSLHDIIAAVRGTLEEAGALVTTEQGRLEYLDDGSSPADAIQAAVELAETRQKLVRSRIEMMRGYAETTDCRRRSLLGYFGEPRPHPCDNCDNCDAGTAEDASAQSAEYPVDSTVRHVEWGDGVVVSSDQDELTVLFEEVGYKTLAVSVVRERKLLEVVPGS